MAVDRSKINFNFDFERYRSNCLLGCQTSIPSKILNHHLQTLFISAIIRYFLLQISLNNKNCIERNGKICSQKDIKCKS